MTAAVEETPVRRPISDIEPRSYTPEEMLVFPPNSLYALAVGWNLNGGRNVYLKSQIRGRERFVGKWRHWDLDGTRDLAEMDAPESEFLFAQMGHGSSVRVPDWKAMRKDAWWNGNSQGGSNRQPLQSYSNFPWRHTRRLGTYEWGVYPDINAEITYFSNSTRVADEHEVLSEHIRPMRPRHTAQSPNMTNIYDGPLGRRAADWLRDVCTGDVRGEAYLCSVERFVKGAMDSSKKSMSKTQDGGLRLDDYVFEKWHNGVLNSRPRLVIQKTLASLSSANDPASHNDPNRANLLALARGAYHRLVLRNLISPSNPLDIAILLREPSEFGLPGIGGKEGVISGLDWAANEITRMSSDLAAKSKSSKRARSPEVTASVKRVRVKLDTDVRSTGSSPLTAPPDSPPATNRSELILSTEAALRRLRLELVSLSKFYPLAGLKKMDKKQAERLLPENVRKIMSKTT